MRKFAEITWKASVFLLFLTLPLRAEWRFEAYLGKASTSNADLKVEQPSRQNDLLFHNVEYTDRSFHTPLYYGLRGGYFVSPHSNFGFEVEFVHAKLYSNSQQEVYVSGIREGESIDSTVRLGEIVQNFSMSHGLNFLFFNLVGRLGFFRNKDNQTDKVGLYSRLGIGPLIPHTESVIDRERKEQYEFHGPAYQLAAGIEINILEKLLLLLEYKFTYVSVKNAKVAYGHAENDIRTRHLVFGVGRKF
jgi:opacity protein-like surface antigen